MAGGKTPDGETGIADESAEPSLLDSDESAPFEITNASAGGNPILVCDHASNRMPRSLGTLGLAPEDLQSHIAWDPGAAEVARRLSDLLDAPLVLSGYSRLVIDCNRPPDSPDSIPRRTGGVAVPGNRRLSPEERLCRIKAVFNPYHEAVRRVIDGRAGRPNLLLSIHSFTAVLNGQRRPWSVGFSYGRDDRLALPFIRTMSSDTTILVGENQPYAVDDFTDYTIPVHGEARGLPHVLIEIRQDLIARQGGATEWARRLADVFSQIEPEALQLTKNQ